MIAARALLAMLSVLPSVGTPCALFDEFDFGAAPEPEPGPAPGPAPEPAPSPGPGSLPVRPATPSAVSRPLFFYVPEAMSLRLCP